MNEAGHVKLNCFKCDIFKRHQDQDSEHLKSRVNSMCVWPCCVRVCVCSCVSVRVCLFRPRLVYEQYQIHFSHAIVLADFVLILLFIVTADCNGDLAIRLPICPLNYCSVL